MVDPDAPGGIGGDHKWRHFLHWLVSHSPGVPSLNALPAMHTGDELQVVNIPGPAVKKGEALAPYKGKQMQPVLRAIDSTQDQTTEMSTVAAGPAPPKGKHRYVILLWKQLGEVRAPAVEQRKGWHPVNFAKVWSSVVP